MFNFDVGNTFVGELTLLIFIILGLILAGLFCFKCNKIRNEYVPVKTSPATTTDFELGKPKENTPEYKYIKWLYTIQYTTIVII